MTWTTFKFNRVRGTTLLGACGLLTCLTLAPTVGLADSQQVVGVSPTDYVPATDAQKELQAFQELVRLRDTGRISPTEYQHLLMEIAAGNKRVVQQGGPSLPQTVNPIDPSVTSRPLVSLLPPIPKPIRPMALAYVSTKSPLPLPPKPKANLLLNIQRPSGTLRRVANKDVPQLYSIRSYRSTW